jgi:hypothetical protein
MTVRSRISLASMAVGLLLLPLSAARAELFTTPAGATNPNTGRPASASADFELSGGNLVITLTNTLVNPSQTTPGDVLTDVDFSINGSGAVTGTGGSVIASAVGNNGVDVTATTGTDVTAGYQFATGVTTTNGPPLTSEFGVSATSYNGSGATATTVTNMAPDTSAGQIFTPIDGSNWGLVPNLASTTGLQSGGNNYFVFNSVTITLPVTTTFSLSDITGVFFTFGSEQAGIPSSPSVPEPSSMAIAGLGSLGFLAYGLRRRLKK